MISDILKREMIGRDIEIVQARNASLVGIKGRIVDETKNTFRVMVGESTKTIMKEQITFIVACEGRKIKIEGNRMCFRPEERVKKIR